MGTDNNVHSITARMSDGRTQECDITKIALIWVRTMSKTMREILNLFVLYIYACLLFVELMFGII